MNKELIFQSYLDEKCPLCDSEDLSDMGEHTQSGKTMAIYFRCGDCLSEYTVGMRRSAVYIESEITTDNFNKVEK